MKIAMIGASGFVGTRLINLLKEEPAKYTCLSLIHISEPTRL